MRISLGRCTGKVVTQSRITKITLYRIVKDGTENPNWETPKELIEHIQKLFGPTVTDY